VVTEREIENIGARAKKATSGDIIEEGGIGYVSYTKTKGWANSTSDKEKVRVGTILDQTKDRESNVAKSFSGKWSYGVVPQ